MRFVIITPFSRPKNLPALLDMFEKAKAGCEVTWKPVVHDLETLHLLHSSGNWIEPFLSLPPNGWDQCYWKCNQALELWAPRDTQSMTGFLCDDDTYSPGFFPAVAAAGGEVVVVSARRYGGQEGPFGVLPSAPGEMRACHVGLEQFFVRGDIMAQFRFNNHGCADGEMVEKLFARNPGGFRYLPDTYVNWNILPK